MRLLWHRYLWTSPGDPCEEHALTSWTWRTCTPREYMQRPAAKEREIPSRSSLLIYLCARFNVLCIRSRVLKDESEVVRVVACILH